MTTKIDGSISRRRFLAAAAVGGGAALLGPGWLGAGAQASDARLAQANDAGLAQAADAGLARATDARLAQVKAKTVAIDMHNHVFSGATGVGSPPGQLPGPDSGLSFPLREQLKQAGLTAVVAGYKIPFDPNAKPGETNEKLLDYLSVMDQLLAQQGMRRSLTEKDLEEAHRKNQPTVVQAIEGAQFLEGHLERIEVAYKRGLRHLQLLHDNDDPVMPQGDLDSKPAHLGGLTPFGAEVIRECNRLGILVDMAHGSPETILAATKVAKRPFIMSHTGFDYPVDENQRMYPLVKARRLTKERAKVIADQGGLIGIWIYLARTPQEYVEDVKHMVDAVGIDHVGIGSDTDLLAGAGKGTNFAWPGMAGGFFDTVAAEMLAQGFTVDEIAKFGGGNYCRVFGQAVAGH